MYVQTYIWCVHEPFNMYKMIDSYMQIIYIHIVHMLRRNCMIYIYI